MDTDRFFLKWNNIGCDFDGYYGFQCMDLYQQYNKEVMSGPHLPSPAAADVWNNYPKVLYERISNTPNNFPVKGDVIIWKKAPSLPFGHISVCYSADTSNFVSFDQNWPVGSTCHFQNHNYTNVQGWLRPKSAIIAQPIPQLVITDQTRIPQLDNQEVGAIRSIIMDIYRDLEDSRRANTQQAAMLTDLRKQLEKCQTSPSTPHIPVDYTVSELLAMLVKKLFKG